MRHQEQALGEGRDLAAEPGAEYDQGPHDGQEAGQVGEGGVLNLGRSLKRRHEQTDDGCDPDDRERERDGQQEGLLGLRDERGYRQAQPVWAASFAASLVAPSCGDASAAESGVGLAS